MFYDADAIEAFPFLKSFATSQGSDVWSGFLAEAAKLFTTIRELKVLGFLFIFVDCVELCAFIFKPAITLDVIQSLLV